MIRAIAIFIVAALGAGLVAWLVDNPGWVTVDWFGFRLETPMSIMAVVMVLAFIALYLALRLLRAIVKSPGALRAVSGRHRAEQGMGALTEGLAAAAAGDAFGAHRHAARAGRLVKEGSLAAVLALEAAELEGREEDVTALALSLLDHPQTELLGRRALFDLAVKSSQQDRATDEAEAAFENHPTAGWAAEALLADAIRAADWDRAKSILSRAVRHDGFSKDRAHALKPALILAEAMEWMRKNEPQKALGLARKAFEADGAFVAAAVMVAELSLKAGKTKRARDIAQSLWANYPHPALGRVFVALQEGETQEEKLARLHELVGLNPDHVESRLLFAEHAIVARNVIAARDALKDLLLEGTSARAFALMAAQEKVEHGAAAEPEDWIEKALAAPRDGVWVCANCGHSAADWQAVCARCSAVARAEWATHINAPNAVAVAPTMAPAPKQTASNTAVSARTPMRAPVAAPDRKAPRAALISSKATADRPGSSAETSSRQPDDPGTEQKTQSTNQSTNQSNDKSNDKSKGEAAW